MRMTECNKSALQEAFGIIGYFERENAPSVDVICYSKINKIIVGLYQQEETYEVELSGEYPERHFNFGVETFYLKNMKEAI
jgi:phosphopantetheine adenylyltransferase